MRKSFATKRSWTTTLLLDLRKLELPWRYRSDDRWRLPMWRTRWNEELLHRVCEATLTFRDTNIFLPIGIIETLPSIYLLPQRITSYFLFLPLVQVNLFLPRSIIKNGTNVINRKLFFQHTHVELKSSKDLLVVYLYRKQTKLTKPIIVSRSLSDGKWLLKFNFKMTCNRFLGFWRHDS